MTIEHRPTKASELPLVADPSSAELIGVLDGVAGRVPTAKIVEIVKEGASAYEVALKQGFEGTEQEWLDSLIGDLTDQARVEREAAEAAREGSQTARTGAEDARDGIQAALANIDGYDETLGRLSPAARRIVSAADVRAACVYNTTLDTDGGAWRRRVPGGFPSKALIIGRDASLTIYDADDPACPVHRTITRTSGASTTREFWRNGRAPTCLAAAEGMVAFGLATPAPAVGLCLIDLVQARVGRLSGGYDGGWSLPGVLDMLNTEGDDILSGVGAVLGSNSAVNHVAMRVAPGTRLDPNRCDLPMPTIAVGTDAGLSVVLPDGRVTNSVTGGIVSAVAFLGNGDLVWQISSNWGTQYTRRADRRRRRVPGCRADGRVAFRKLAGGCPGAPQPGRPEGLQAVRRLRARRRNHRCVHHRLPPGSRQRCCAQDAAHHVGQHGRPVRHRGGDAPRR